MNTHISISQVFKQGWELTKKHMGFLVVSFIVYILAYGLLALLARGHGFIAAVAQITTSVLSILYTIGLYRIALLILKGGTPKPDDFRSDIGLFFSVLWCSIIVGFFTFVGFICLIIPGIIVALRLSMAQFLVIEKNLSGWQAAKLSWNLTRGYSWKILGFALLAGLIFLISLIPIGLGLLVSVPFVAISYVLLYKKIEDAGHAAGIAPEAPSTIVTPPPATTPTV